MKVIHRRTGIDIMQCNNIETLKEIILEQMEGSVLFSERYAFYVLKCYKESKPIPNFMEWLKLINE